MILLEDILGSRANIAILRFLTAVRGGLSGNEIANRLGLRQSSARQALERLVRTGLVSRTDVGRTAAYELVHEMAIAETVLAPLFEAEERQREDILKEVVGGCKKLLPAPRVVVLFGSLARAGRVFRDVDLLLVARSAGEKSSLRDAIPETFERISNRYGIPVNPVVVAHSQLRSPGLSSLLREVRRDGILLNGKPPAELKDLKIWK